MVTRIGLDLGYANITLCDVSAGIFREPAVALIDKDTRRIISVGTEALEKSEELEGKALLVRPFKNGLLFDKQITRSIIFKAVEGFSSAERVRCVVGVPSDITPKQEKDLFDMFSEAGISDCFTVSRTLAALVGAKHSPLESIISVNVGAYSTEIAVLNEGEITYSCKTDVGGEDFDKAVKQYIFEQGDVNVSISVARTIKEKLGSVWRGKEEETVEIEGTLSLTGNRVKMAISTEDIVGVFEKPLHKLLMAVADAIKRIPLDNVEKTFENGIVLTGGGAMIHGLDMMMSKVLGVPVSQPDNPIDSVAVGLAEINAMIPMKGKSANKNVTLLIPKYYKEKNKK